MPPLACTMPPLAVALLVLSLAIYLEYFTDFIYSDWIKISPIIYRYIYINFTCPDFKDKYPLLYWALTFVCVILIVFSVQDLFNIWNDILKMYGNLGGSNSGGSGGSGGPRGPQGPQGPQGGPKPRSPKVKRSEMEPDELERARKMDRERKRKNPKPQPYRKRNAMEMELVGKIIEKGGIKRVNKLSELPRLYYKIEIEKLKKGFQI